MPNLKLSIQLEIDGNPVSGFPLVRRITVDELQQYQYEEPDDGDTVTFSALPADQIASIQALLVQTDQEITLRFDGQSDAGIVLNSGGIILILDGTIDAGAGASNAKVNNNSGTIANLKGFAGGT